MTKNESKATNVVVFNDEVLNKVRSEKKAVVGSQKDYRRELSSNLEELQRMYEKDYNNTKGSIDYLCTVSGCKAQDFFSVDFVKSLYKTYTFKVIDSEEVRTLIAEEHNVTEKTDFAKLAERAENCHFIGARLNIAASKHTEKQEGKKVAKVKYWMPVVNFTAYNILGHLLSLDAYVLGVAAYKKAKKAEKGKAKKAEKKAAKKAAAEKAEESK